MAKNSKVDKMLLAGAGVALAVALFAKASSAKPASNALVQTANVGGRLYSVTKLGQGNYIVTLVSTNGVLETSPTNYTFSQTGELGSIGAAAKVAQLKADLPNMQLNFAA